jgi:hypothetical protein
VEEEIDLYRYYFRCPIDYELPSLVKFLNIEAIQNPINEKFLKYCLSEKIASH